MASVYDKYGNYLGEESDPWVQKQIAPIPDWPSETGYAGFGDAIVDYEVINGKTYGVSYGGRLYDPSTGNYINRNAVPAETGSTSTGSRYYGGGYGGGGGGGGSMGQSEVFFDWFGRYPNATEKSIMENEGWTADTIRRAATGTVKRSGAFLNANGRVLDEERSRVRIALAPYFGGDPGAVPATMVDGFVSDNASSDYLVNVYGPRLKGISADNPLVADFINTYVSLTGKNPGQDALDKLEDIIGAYGVTDVAMAAWEGWVKTTPAAISGNYGAEHRAEISNVINNVLGRYATEAELAPNSSYWNLKGPALLEQIRATPEHQAIYGDMPAWITEEQFIDGAAGLEYVMRWAYGDRVILNQDGSLTFPTGPHYEEPTTQEVTTTVENVRPEWKSLTYAKFNQELKDIGITVEGSGPTGTYKDAEGNVIGWNELINHLPPGQFYKDTQGYHYVQEPGAINPQTNAETPGWSPTTTTTTTVPAPGNFGGFGFTYSTPDMVADMFNNHYTPEMIMQEIRWGEEAVYLEGTMGEVLTEAYGSTAGIDWYVVASGAIGSGAMRAKIMQAQNRVAYREAYRQVFGSDPSPADYDRITEQFVSPGELLREHQAIESADEMYDEVNELLQRVMGQTVTKEELKDMVLGRPNSGELRALINQATKLDQYRWVHKQYYEGQEPTPDDYANYAGYSGAAELQWEILTKERIAELGPQINEAFRRAYGYELSSDELQAMLGEQEGYGDLRRLYTEAQEEVKKQEVAVLAAHEEEKLEIGYSKGMRGGFETTLKPFEEL